MRCPHVLRCLLLLAALSSPTAAPAQSSGKAVEDLLATLGGAADPLVRAAAAERLGELKQGEAPVAAALIDALAFDPDYPVRGRAAEALGRLGPIIGEVVPALAEALAWDQHLMVRWRAAEALQRIGSERAEVGRNIAPLLIAALGNDPYPGVRARAAQALGGVAHADGDMLAALLNAYRHDSQAGVRWQAAKALGDLARHFGTGGTKESVAQLREAMTALARDPHPDIQSYAAALGQTIRRLEMPLGSNASD
jgi:HEAT repeat protein